MVCRSRCQDQGVRFERGRLGTIPYAAVGDGPPVLAIGGMSTVTGVDSDMTVRSTLEPLRALAHTRRIYVTNRRPGLPRDMTMTRFGDEYAQAIEQGFTGPVDVVGASTGGSIAAQLAADHPDVVRRLVLVSAACRLGPVGREDQARIARHIRAGRRRRAIASGAAALVPPWRGRTLAAAVSWLAAKRLVPQATGWDDMVATIDAEDGFDLATCASPVRAPALILAGRLDRFYSPALFEETAALIPVSELRIGRRSSSAKVLFGVSRRNQVAAGGRVISE